MKKVVGNCAEMGQKHMKSISFQLLVELGHRILYNEQLYVVGIE